MKVKQLFVDLPIIGQLAGLISRTWGKPRRIFQGSESYWKSRYETGGDSGYGSYSQLAELKSEVLNAFVRENGIESVIEYGCGDGNQLSLAQYPNYIGFDVSPHALSGCMKRFSADATKTFKPMDTYADETAELTLSLDVLFHLVEDGIFADYMERLFTSSEKFVVIYSSDTDVNPDGTPEHVRHRKFSRWIEDNKAEWKLVRRIPTKYPLNADTKSGSFADFYIYSKI